MRLVSLCPSITKLVFDLGMGSSLVGITKYCIHPQDQVALVEKVGGTKDPKIERICQLQPDWVLLNKEENRREDFEALTSAGIPCNVTFPEDVDGAISALLALGELMQVPSAAREMASHIERAREAATAHRDRRAQLRWAYLIWRKPWMAVNGHNYIHALLAEVGGRNIFADAESVYPAVTAEELRDLDPHLVILSSEPFPFKDRHRTELAEATGLPLERFVLADGEALSWHCCETARGLRLAQELLDKALNQL